MPCSKNGAVYIFFLVKSVNRESSFQQGVAKLPKTYTHLAFLIKDYLATILKKTTTYTQLHFLNNRYYLTYTQVAFLINRFDYERCVESYGNATMEIGAFPYDSNYSYSIF